MAEYHLKVGKLGQNVMNACRKNEQAFIRTFLQKDPDSPSGYRLKTGKTAQRAVGAYLKIEESVVGAYHKIETAFTDTFLERSEPQPPEHTTGSRKTNRRNSK